MRIVSRAMPIALGLACCLAIAAPATAQGAAEMAAAMAAMNGGGDDEKKPDFPKFKKVAEDYRQVQSTPEGSLYNIWVRDKDGQMLAELPSNYAKQIHYIALTLPVGELFAGLQMGEMYGSWKRFDKRVAFLSPDLSTKSSGDQPSKDSLSRHYTDRVLFDVPIVCMGPKGQPVIDLDDLFVAKASTFYGGMASGANKALATVAKAKTFPENVELAFEVPVRGQMKVFHYSISRIPNRTGYTPREADERVGYFTTVHRDLGVFDDEAVWKRYINRWHLEKADSKLSLSPPKEPIVYYVEHTVPVRYRRWVKEGVEYWNDAFEKVGLSDAIVVHYQDKSTGAHMDKDPEDVRYNFLRWLSNDIGTAIGPSRAHPETGQILDADIILTDGWIRAFYYYANEYLPSADTAMEGMTRETLAWFDRHPDWDPRVRLASPAEREEILADRARRQALARSEGVDPIPFGDTSLADDEQMHELARILGPDKSVCLAADGKAREMALIGLTMAILDDHDDDEGDEEDGEDGDDDEDKEDLIDGIPESFLGPMLADLVAHEVGHTLGLRHNFKASSLYTMEEINSEDLKDAEAFAGSVMDYLPVNVNMDDGDVQGDWAMIGIGPYDYWAIEYGYTFKDPKDVAKHSAVPGHAYSTDYDTSGPDPLARRYDFSKEPLDYCESRMRLANWHRERILDEFVEEGESWGRARKGYQITLGTQTGALSVMANWIGGAYVTNDHKGDPGARPPIRPVAVDDQRRALDFCIENAFYDASFGLSPELLQHMTLQKWSDPSGYWTLYEDATWPIHDTIMGIQASVLSMLMNPSTLRRVYDNEHLVPADEDAFTLAELMDKVSTAIWEELDDAGSRKATERKPMISSLRRNLQDEHVARLIDLFLDEGYGAASKPISDLARSHLDEIVDAIDEAMDHDDRMDAYSRSHLADTRFRIGQALEAQYIANTEDMGGGGSIFFYIGKEAEEN